MCVCVCVYLFSFTYLFTHLSTISYLISSFLTHFHSLVLYNFCYLLNTYINCFYYNIKCEVMSQGPIPDIAK